MKRHFVPCIRTDEPSGNVRLRTSSGNRLTVSADTSAISYRHERWLLEVIGDSSIYCHLPTQEKMVFHSEEFLIEEEKTEVTMYLVFRADLELKKGKLAAQAGHATQLAMRMAEKRSALSRHWLSEWERGSYPKVALKVLSEENFDKLIEVLNMRQIAHAVVVDEGRTEIPAGTRTALATLPRYRSDLHAVTSTMKLL